MANIEHYKEILTNGTGIVAFDADSTLYPFEAVDELARTKGVYDRVSQITRGAMEGKILFDAAFRERYGVIRPSRHDLQSEGKRAATLLNPNAAKIFELLPKHGVECHIISGGCLEGLYPLMQAIAVQKENIHANQIVFDSDGAYTGYDEENPLSHDRGKSRVMDQIATGRRFMMVGDGATDKEVEENCVNKDGMVVGYGGVVRRSWLEDHPVTVYARDISAVFPMALGANRWKDVYNKDSESRDLLWQGLCGILYGAQISDDIAPYRANVKEFLATHHKSYMQLSTVKCLV